MDINFLRTAATVTCALAILGIIVWTFCKSSKKGFDEAANIPFDNALDSKDDRNDTKQRKMEHLGENQ